MGQNADGRTLECEASRAVLVAEYVLSVYECRNRTQNAGDGPGMVSPRTCA